MVSHCSLSHVSLSEPSSFGFRITFEPEVCVCVSVCLSVCLSVCPHHVWWSAGATIPVTNAVFPAATTGPKVSGTDGAHTASRRAHTQWRLVPLSPFLPPLQYLPSLEKLIIKKDARCTIPFYFDRERAGHADQLVSLHPYHPPAAPPPVTLQDSRPRAPRYG